MKSLRAVLVVLLFLLLAASMAQASVVVEPGAPADYSRLRWADAVIHTNPVLGRGLGPEMVSPGYQIVPLSATDQNGQPVTAYISWMTGRNGKKVWVKFRPGEPVERLVDRLGLGEAGRGVVQVDHGSVPRGMRRPGPPCLVSDDELLNIQDCRFQNIAATDLNAPRLPPLRENIR